LGVLWWAALISPLPLIWLFATWRQRLSWTGQISLQRQIARLLVTFLIPLLGMAGLFCLFRVVEIPVVPEDLSALALVESVASEHEETDAMYRDALTRLHVDPVDFLLSGKFGTVKDAMQRIANTIQAQPSSKDDGIEQLHVIGRRKFGGLAGTPHIQGDLALTLVAVLRGASQRATSQGDTLESWACLATTWRVLSHWSRNCDYTSLRIALGVRDELIKDMWHWALQQAVNPEHLRSALREWAELEASWRISGEFAKCWDYVLASDWFETGVVPADAADRLSEHYLGYLWEPAPRTWFSRLPWEQARIRRILRQTAIPTSPQHLEWLYGGRWEWTSSTSEAIDCVRYIRRSEDLMDRSAIQFRAGLAVLEHRHRNGEWPANFNELAPECRELIGFSQHESEDSFFILPRGFLGHLDTPSHGSVEVNGDWNTPMTITTTTACLLRMRLKTGRFEDFLQEIETVDQCRDLCSRLHLEVLPLEFDVTASK
jgi:hypothetical protein